MKSPVELLSSFLDDVKRLEPGVRGLDRDLHTIKMRFKHEGYGFISVALSALCDAFDTGISSGRFTCIPNFKTIRNGTIPVFLQGMFCKVFDPKTGQRLEEPDIGIIKLIREFLRLFKKVVSTPKREKKLDLEARRSFIETDMNILEDFPKNALFYFDSVSRLVLPNLDGFCSEDLDMKHGPGTVAERVFTNQKWSALRKSLSDKRFLADKYGLSSMTSDGHSTVDYSAVEAPSFEDILYEADLLNGLVPQLTSSGTAELLTVPKTSTALRTITREPVLNMFIQQGLNTLLRDHIAKDAVLKGCLALTDQSKNQKLALIGSLTDEWSTIDLSSASDLLSLSLVKRAFATKPRFLTCVLESRSSHCDTGLGIIELRKFAGMGNALTFPVQSMIYGIILISCILSCEGLRPSYGNVLRAARRICVYGDDILIPRKYSRQACDWLTSFGMRVNTKKSFLDGNFKESCGVDAYRGYDVTPVYLRYKPIISDRDPDQIASLVSTQNQLWLRGLYASAQCIVDEISKFYHLPLVSKTSSGLGLHSHVDTNVAHKWDGKLQRLVFRALCVETITRSDNISDYDALFASLHKLERRKRQFAIVSDSPDWLAKSVIRFRTRIRRRWKPATAG